MPSIAARTGARRTPLQSAHAPELELPEVTADLRPRIGSSQIDEFVLAHAATDILRELVQNEFDGGGSEMTIRFGQDTVSIAGTGRQINAEGWTRLSVIMGTGEVIGDGQGEQIEPKENGIGSKNFGLRSLFSYADRIHVRSSGRMAVLDVRHLVAGLQADPLSESRAGVLVQAPYRTQGLRKLPPFTVDRERRALQEIERALFPTLVKLALDGKRQGVRRLEVISERTGLALRWRQTVQTLSCSVPRVAVHLRKGRLTRRSGIDKPSNQTHEEIEFSRYVDIPQEFNDQDFPGYYRSGSRLKVAISLPLRTGKTISKLGHFYYPLEAGHARTGCAISVSAPFTLNADRSRLIDTEWNGWLKEQAADLVVELVGADWFARFGVAAYEALASLPGEEEEDSFQSLVATRLQTAQCWMSADNRHPRSASQLVVPDYEALGGHLETAIHLHPDLAASPTARLLAIKSGMRRFSLNSLVRLRCAGADRTALATEIKGDEADYHYTDFADTLLDPEIQSHSAKALTQLHRHLSPDNRRDIAETASTLSASGELRAAESLILVPAEMWEGCPAPIEARLHPDLGPHTAVARYCKPFELRDWVRDAAIRAQEGAISEAERLALYRFLIAADTRLPTATLALVRRSPVFRAEGGEWSAAEDFLWPPTKDQPLLALAAPRPARELRTKVLLHRYRIRRTPQGRDLLAVARAFTDHSELTGAFEGLLRRHVNLLTPRTIRELSSIKCLRSRAGSLAAPASLHLPTPISLACLSDAAELVAGGDLGLYRRLLCRESPAATTLLRILADSREHGRPPPHPQHFYPALAGALRSERQPLGALLHEPILYVGDQYVSPFSCLVSSRAPRCLMGAVPIFKSGGLIADSYLELGAAPFPREQHWEAFFEFINARSLPSPATPLAKHERLFLLEAYQRARSRFPEDLSPTTRWMLSERGTVHCLAELEAGRFLENDYPELAEALIAAGAPIAFADDSNDARSLFRAFGLKPLSHMCGEARVTIGADASAPTWFRSDRIIDLLHGDDLAHGLFELAFAHQKQNPEFVPVKAGDLRRRLAAIRRIRFVQVVRRTYHFLKRVDVSAEAAVLGAELALRPPSRRWDFEHILASELAQLAGAKRLPDIRTLVSAILPLIQAESAAERLAYLQRLGIRPRRWPADQEEDVLAREDDLLGIGEELVHNLVGSVRIDAKRVTAVTPAPTAPPQPRSSDAPAVLTLPPLNQVALTVSNPARHAPAAASASNSDPVGARSTAWKPRSPEEMERDAQVGRRGEEMVYRAEIERLRALGRVHPEQDVVWTSSLDAGADHDIRSLGEDGEPIWIEVKSTTGSDGRFDWARREFEKALREGPRYQLWRIYNAAGHQPEAKVFRDPIALIKNSVLRLEIGDLRVFVEAK